MLQYFLIIEVSYADYTLQIPSNKKFKSLNLSHSLIIIAQVVSGFISILIKNLLVVVI